MELPKQYVDNMSKLLSSDEFSQYMASFNANKYSGLRVNTLKLSCEEFEKICPFPIKRIPWIENGYYYDEEYKPAKHPYYFAGLYYIQEPSAMTPANRLPINSGDKVLDMCAAPGGKTTELAAKLNGTGVLYTNDISNTRAKALLKNVELMGISNAYVLSEDPKKLVNYFENYFDKILVDAPCSGEGMFRKDSNLIKEWENNGPDYYATIQKELILYAYDMLKPGGYIMFSTCTFSPLENEETILHLMNNREGVMLCDISPYEGFSNGLMGLSKCVRIWPHKMEGEGHFLALIKKENDESIVNYRTNKKDKAPKLNDEVLKFFKLLNFEIPLDELIIIDAMLLWLPKEGINEAKLRKLRSGLLLGTLDNKRFEPSQALAMYLKKDMFKNTIDFLADDPMVIKYLKGETLEVLADTANGWNLVCVDGFSLGFAKLNNGTLKNKYYKGWRWQ